MRVTKVAIIAENIIRQRGLCFWFFLAMLATFITFQHDSSKKAFHCFNTNGSFGGISNDSLTL